MAGTTTSDPRAPFPLPLQHPCAQYTPQPQAMSWCWCWCCWMPAPWHLIEASNIIGIAWKVRKGYPLKAMHYVCVERTRGFWCLCLRLHFSHSFLTQTQVARKTTKIPSKSGLTSRCISKNAFRTLARQCGKKKNFVATTTTPAGFPAGVSSHQRQQQQQQRRGSALRNTFPLQLSSLSPSPPPPVTGLHDAACSFALSPLPTAAGGSIILEVDVDDGGGGDDDDDEELALFNPR